VAVVVSKNRINENAGEPRGNWGSGFKHRGKAFVPAHGRSGVGAEGGRLLPLRRSGVLPQEKFVCAKSCNLVHFFPENGSKCRS